MLAVTLASLAACSGWKSEVTDYSGNVSSNGGIAVVKGDYVYFINGYSDNDVDNAFGKVVRGAVVRVKRADLGTADPKIELVVPKMVYSEYRGDGSGIFISGDYVYYPTPSDKKNSKGQTKNTETEFWRTKLDGTDSSIILTVDSLSLPYRFYEDGNDVFLTLYKTEKDSDDKETGYLVTYDVKGKEVKKSASVEAYDLGAFGGAYAYYTHIVHDDKLDVDESFNALYRYSFNGKEDVEILNGKGGFGNEGKGIGTEGAKFSIVKVSEKTLYLSMSQVDTSASNSTVYYALDYSDLNAAGTEEAVNANVALLNKDRVINEGTNDAQTIFASNSIYVAKNCIIYFNGNEGLVKYDYNDRDGLHFGLSYIFDDDKLKTYSFVTYNEGKAYFIDAEGYYYSVDLSKIVDLSTGATLDNPSATVDRLTYETTFTLGEWFDAEFIGDYLLYKKTGAPYYEYIFVADVKAFDNYVEKNDIDVDTDEAREKAISDFVAGNNEFTKEGFEDRLSRRLALLTEEDVAALEDYMKEFNK